MRNYVFEVSAMRREEYKERADHLHNGQKGRLPFCYKSQRVSAPSYVRSGIIGSFDSHCP